MWQVEWPDKPGMYWFYGWTWCGKDFSKEGLPKLISVEVRTTANSKLIYVAKGNFMYKSERHYGLWTSADLPEPPPSDALAAVVSSYFSGLF